MSKISALPIAQPLDGSETLPIVQTGSTKRTTLDGFIAAVTPKLQNWYKGDRGDKGDKGLDASELAERRDFIATAGQSEFNLGFDYRPGIVSVFLNGVLLPASDYVAVGGRKITMIGDPLGAGDEVVVLAFLAPNTVKIGLDPFITPAMFGAIGDGVADDTIAWRKLALWSRTTAVGGRVGINLGSARYRLTDKVTFETQVVAYGAAAQIICDSPTAQIRCEINTDEDYTGQTASFDGLEFITTGIYPVCPLSVRCTATALGTTRTASLRNCVFRGRDGFCGFGLAAAEFINSSYVEVREVRIIGDRNNRPLQSPLGLRVVSEAGFDKGDLMVDRLCAFFVVTSVAIRGHHEGMKFTNLTIVAGMIGIDYQSDFDQIEPLISVHNCHINVEYIGILLRGIVQASITDNCFYYSPVQLTAPEYHAIDWAGRLATELASVVTGNVFHMVGSDKRTIGMFVQGDPSGSSQSLIVDNNHFYHGNFGIVCDASTKNVYVGVGNTYTNVGTPILSASNDNHLNIRTPTGNYGWNTLAPNHPYQFGRSEPTASTMMAIENTSPGGSDRRGAGFRGLGRRSDGSQQFAGAIRWRPVGGAIDWQDGVCELYTVRNGVEILAGIFMTEGSPEGVVSAPPGAMCTRRDGGPGSTFYIKESGFGTIGWVAK